MATEGTTRARNNFAADEVIEGVFADDDSEQENFFSESDSDSSEEVCNFLTLSNLRIRMFRFKSSKYNIPLVESSIWYLKSSATKIFELFFSNNPNNS